MLKVAALTSQELRVEPQCNTHIQSMQSQAQVVMGLLFPINMQMFAVLKQMQAWAFYKSLLHFRGSRLM